MRAARVPTAVQCTSLVLRARVLTRAGAHAAVASRWHAGDGMPPAERDGGVDTAANGAGDVKDARTLYIEQLRAEAAGARARRDTALRVGTR
jgi:hypothetical protein